MFEDLGSEDVEGGKFAVVIWWDDHAPPMFASAGIEYVQADGGGWITRITGSFSILSFPGGGSRWSLVLKPIVGFEYNDFDDSGFGALAGAGGEFAIRPTRRTQVVLEYNWFKNFGGDNSQQLGLGFRYSF